MCVCLASCAGLRSSGVVLVVLHVFRDPDVILFPPDPSEPPNRSGSQSAVRIETDLPVKKKLVRIKRFESLCREHGLSVASDWPAATVLLVWLSDPAAAASLSDRFVSRTHTAHSTHPQHRWMDARVAETDGDEHLQHSGGSSSRPQSAVATSAQRRAGPPPVTNGIGNGAAHTDAAQRRRRDNGRHSTLCSDQTRAG